jgi:GT2 family glycosyltransferase
VSTLSIIIVSHNTRDLLARCLTSIREAGYRQPYEVLVIDNASSDGSAEMVAERFPDVRVVRNEANLGFSAANNRGVTLSSGDHILLLNSDAQLKPGTLESMVERLDRDPDLGIIGPRIENPDGLVEISWGKDLNPFRELLRKALQYFHRRKNPLALAWVRSFTSRSRLTHWVSGACLLCRRDAYLRAGLMDQDFFLYMEDIDLCRRVRGLGFKVAYYPEATVLHVRGASTDKDPARVSYEYRKSQLLFYRKKGNRLWFETVRYYLALKALARQKREPETWGRILALVRSFRFRG